jgi:WD40 repeat protein
MNCFNNENLLKLILSSLTLFKTYQMLCIITNKPLANIILRAFSYKNIYNSMGQAHVIPGMYNENITSLALLPNDNLIVATNKTCEIWDLCNQSRVKTLDAHRGSVLSLQDGNIAIVSKSRIKVLNPQEDFKCIGSTYVKGYSYFRNLIMLSNKNLCFSAFKINNLQPAIIILDYNNKYKLLKIISGFVFNFIALVNVDVNHFASGADEKIKIWDKDYICLKTIDNAHDGWISSLLFAYNLLISSADMIIKVWDVKNDYMCVKIIKTNENIRLLFLLPNGFFASCSSNEFTIKIWDLETFGCVNVLHGHKKEISSLIMLKDKRIASASFEKLILWNY